MNKQDTIKELESLKIPHDPKAKAEDLTALLSAVKAASSDAAKAAASKPSGTDGLSEDQVKQVKAKVSAGLTKAQAVEVVRAQAKNDEALKKSETAK